MSKIVTSITFFNDAVGLRLSATYSEIDETGKVISDNKRVDRVVTDAGIKSTVADLYAYAESVMGD